MKNLSLNVLTPIIITAILFFMNLDNAMAQTPNQANDQQSQSQEDVVEIIQQNDNHSIFLSLLEEANVVGILKEEGPYTLIAPTNQALERTNIDSLKQNHEELLDFVSVHILRGEFSAADVEETTNISITEGGVKASNGIIHIINEVIKSTSK